MIAVLDQWLADRGHATFRWWAKRRYLASLYARGRQS
jgi:hypothetical protein